MTIPEPNEFRQLDTFPRLRNCTPKLPCILHPPCFFCVCSPLVVFSAFNCCIHFSLRLMYCFCRFLCLLFCACSCTVFFLRVSSRETIHANFSVGGAFLYSGFNFSHSDLPFPTRCCIPYVRSGLYQLVICVKGFRVCALHCELAIISIRHCIIRFCHRRGHHAFRESSCVSLAHGPRWLFLLSRHRKDFLLLLIRSLL